MHCKNALAVCFLCGRKTFEHIPACGYIFCRVWNTDHGNMFVIRTSFFVHLHTLRNKVCTFPPLKDAVYSKISLAFMFSLCHATAKYKSCWHQNYSQHWKGWTTRIIITTFYFRQLQRASLTCLRYISSHWVIEESWIVRIYWANIKDTYLRIVMRQKLQKSATSGYSGL